MSTATVSPPPPLSEQIAQLGPNALYEVVDGVAVEKPAMSALSNAMKSRLQTRMDSFVEEVRLGRVVTQTVFVLTADGSLQRRPEVAFVSAQRWPLDREINWEGEWNVVPDLCVEVTSPNDLYVEVMGRLDEYFRCGVRQVWIVRPPEQEVHVYRNREQKSIIEAGGTLTSEDILPGFALRMGDLFK